MTETEKNYAKSLNWIIFPGDFLLTEAMNLVFKKDWIRECDTENMFEVPAEQLTETGKKVLERLIFARDILGIPLDYEVFTAVFRKVRETENRPENETAFREFALQQALADEDYETARRLANL